MSEVAEAEAASGGEEAHEKRGRVRAMLRELSERGLRPRRGQTRDHLAEDHDQLIRALDHMAPENLATLRDLILDAAGGARRDEWPSMVVIRNLGMALQARPFEERRIVRSWLSSIEGPRAAEAGYLVPLYRFLRQHGRPPLALDMRKIGEDAAEARRRVVLIEEREAQGIHWEDDARWLEEWRRDEAAAQLLVAGERAGNGL